MVQKRKRHVFVNVPFDAEYEPLFIALIAGLSAYERTPRSVLEIPPQDDRLDRLRGIIATCGASVHDLSRVASSGDPPVPRFNMPFELGLAIGIHDGDPHHKWVVLESEHHRVIRSLSDINGYDVHVHGSTAEGVLRCLEIAFRKVRPLVRHADLLALLRSLNDAVTEIKETSGSLFTHAGFLELVATAERQARDHFADVVLKTREPVVEADDDHWFYLFFGVAQANSVRVTEDEIRTAIADRYKDDGTPFREFCRRIKAPHFDIGVLYLADINNDGRLEYVVCDTNSVGMHNNRIAGIYTPHNAAMLEVEMPSRQPFSKPKTATFFSQPFLSIDLEGTVIMNFSEKHGLKGTHASYVWKGKQIRLVERVQTDIPRRR